MAIEYLTKWVEAKVVKYVDAKQTIISFYENIISQFGYLKILISDQSSHFLNDLIKLFNINQQKTTPYHPQANGLTEKVNQTLVHILRNRDGLKI